MIKKIWLKSFRVFCALLFCGMGGTLFADDVYVSSKGLHDVGGVIWGTYTDDAGDHDAYTNLQEAVNVAAKDSTVWVDNDYVLDSGSVTSEKRTVRLNISKAITVRGQSGDWRTGPIIRGAYATAYAKTDETKCGAGAVICATGVSTAKLIGFRLLGGATLTAADNSGRGGGISNVPLENCLVADCAAYENSGGTYNCNTTDSVISNCYCGGAANSYGGGARGGTHTRTLFVDCRVKSNGGGIDGGSTYDCVITNCTSASYGGATRATSCYRTKIYGGTAKNGGGAGYQSNFYDGCLIYACGNSAV